MKIRVRPAGYESWGWYITTKIISMLVDAEFTYTPRSDLGFRLKKLKREKK